MLGALSLCFPYSLITNLRSAVEEFPGDQTKGIHKAICTTSTLQWHRPRLDFFDSFLLMFFRRSFQGSLLNYLYRHFSSDFESAVLKKNDFHHTLPLIEFLLEKNCFWNERHTLFLLKNISSVQRLLLGSIEISVVGLQKSGKSSILTHLLGVDCKPDDKVATVEVKHITSWHFKQDIPGKPPQFVSLEFWDTPGRNDYTESAAEQARISIGSGMLHLVAISCADHSKPSGTDFEFIKLLLGKYNPNHILVCLTKIDKNATIHKESDVAQLRQRFFDDFKYSTTSIDGTTTLQIPFDNFCLLSLEKELDKTIKQRNDSHFTVSQTNHYRNLLSWGVCDIEGLEAFLRDCLHRAGFIGIDWPRVEESSLNLFYQHPTLMTAYDNLKTMESHLLLNGVGVSVKNSLRGVFYFPIPPGTYFSLKVNKLPVEIFNDTFQ
eukprot:TRINITY_DN5256_c0_g1_i14.p1 TRINITY_DN5256_c0_g1~~TRINITY_DN5256_c0_g1_i14.p1  ORF type:complete len:435 (+),score=58.99 TRINITY_DN5256_c0_g1_i14:166-1470(+)